MQPLTLLTALLVLQEADWTTSLDTCAPRQCRRCNQQVSCHCPSSGKTHWAVCSKSYVDYFDGRTGEAICAPATRLQKHLECSKKDSRFSFDEARVKKVNGHLSCSDLMKHGCVQFPNANPRSLKCWCESLGEVISMHRFEFHLNIYSGHSGELLCPEDPRPGDCTTCDCAKKFTKAAPTTSSTTTAPTHTPTTKKSSQTTCSEPDASTPFSLAESTSPTAPTPGGATSVPPTTTTPPPRASGLVAPIVGAGVVSLLAAAAVALIVARRRRREASKAAPVELRAACHEEFCEENDLYGTL